MTPRLLEKTCDLDQLRVKKTTLQYYKIRIIIWVMWIPDESKRWWSTFPAASRPLGFLPSHHFPPLSHKTSPWEKAWQFFLRGGYKTWILLREVVLKFLSGVVSKVRSRRWGGLSTSIFCLWLKSKNVLRFKAITHSPNGLSGWLKTA